MKADIYESTNKPHKYLTVPAGTNIFAMTFPDNFDSDYLKVAPFMQGIEIDTAQPRIGLNAHEILRDVATQGFATHQVSITTTIKTTTY
jgi:hypothetical protein